MRTIWHDDEMVTKFNAINNDERLANLFASPNLARIFHPFPVLSVGWIFNGLRPEKAELTRLD
jgi:hypothetical protein